jgi:hypothetical protein
MAPVLAIAGMVAGAVDVEGPLTPLGGSWLIHEQTLFRFPNVPGAYPA